MARILLAEDDESLRKFLAAALARAGHDIISVEDGEMAMEAIERETFDVLITDIVMPGPDGIEVARRASELDPDMKIMFITGFAAVSLNSAAKAPSQATVLSKPFHLRELVDQIDKAIAA